MINHDDHALLKYRKLKEGERKPLVKRDFSVKRVFGKVKKY